MLVLGFFSVLASAVRVSTPWPRVHGNVATTIDGCEEIWHYKIDVVY